MMMMMKSKKRGVQCSEEGCRADGDELIGGKERWMVSRQNKAVPITLCV